MYKWHRALSIICRVVTGSRVLSVEAATVEVLKGGKAQLSCGIIKNLFISPFILIQLNNLKNRSINNLCSLTPSLTQTHAGMPPVRSQRGVWAASVAMELILYWFASVGMMTKVFLGPTASTGTGT